MEEKNIKRTQKPVETTGFFGFTVLPEEFAALDDEVRKWLNEIASVPVSGGNEDKIGQDKQDYIMEGSMRNPATSETNSSISSFPKEGESNDEGNGKDMEAKRTELEFAHALYNSVVVLHDESDRLRNDLNALHVHKDMLQSKFQLLDDHIFRLITQLVAKDALLKNTPEERDMYKRRAERLHFELDRLKAEMQSFTGHG